MKIENVKVFGIIDALRGMRNPLNSWVKNDSTCKYNPDDGSIEELHIGENDAKLCNTLVNGGQPHRKFLRHISVIMDITAPTYWWAEMDTYKVCTTRNSCSLQHKGSSREFVSEDFTIDKPNIPIINNINDSEYEEILGDTNKMLEIVNKWRQKYVETKDYTYFRLMRQFIPMSYNYKATWSGNYETLLNIYEWRRNHRLVEWHTFRDAIEKMPGMELFLRKFRKPCVRNLSHLQ